jgi:hypothetical protein
MTRVHLVLAGLLSFGLFGAMQLLHSLRAVPR